MRNNCSFENVDNLMQSLELVIYLPTFVFGLVLNALALVFFCVRLRKWTESTIYITNLALMDLLLLLLLPFKMHATNHRWQAEMHRLCSFLESMYFVGMYGSIFTITCIAVDRYIAIQYPFRANQLRSPKTTLVTCSVIWGVVISATIPVHSFREDKDTDFHCFHGFSKNGWNPFLIGALEIFGFIIPALVIIFCSLKSIHTLRQSERNSTMNRICKRIIYSSLFAFIVPFTPCHIGIFLQFLVRQSVITDCYVQNRIALFVQVAMCLANITCCLDAICFYFIVSEVSSSNETFRRSISQRRTLSTSEV
ncbi:G-protein coupled receptor 55 [Denticeps clupeoides]|uniref:G-protein coupled receptors family 1 profile domain-containing protein n=1 Tax=Denticeps clupeoides TaxID=299321 RepID=A0AAY4EXM8_9TELE|nr:G-protein coupled receptor 55 [Denticeps clupeoides]